MHSHYTIRTKTRETSDSNVNRVATPKDGHPCGLLFDDKEQMASWSSMDGAKVGLRHCFSCCFSHVQHDRCVNWGSFVFQPVHLKIVLLWATPLHHTCCKQHHSPHSAPQLGCSTSHSSKARHMRVIHACGSSCELTPPKSASIPLAQTQLKSW
jgi:hypothetical protein